MTKDSYVPTFKDQTASVPADRRPPRDPDGPDDATRATEAWALSASTVLAETVELPPGNNNNNSVREIGASVGIMRLPTSTSNAAADDHPPPSSTSATQIPFAFAIADNPTGNGSNNQGNNNNNNNSNDATDPAQTNRDHQQKPFPWIAAIVSVSLTVMVVAGVVVGGVCGSGGCGGGAPAEPEREAAPMASNDTTPSPTIAFINSNSYLGVELSPNGTSPEELALQWLIYDDPLQLDVGSAKVDEFRLLQRYSLLTLWFQAGTGTAWSKSTNWTNTDECTWAGIVCELGVVTGVRLEDNGLGGTLSADLGLLSDLTELNLASNSLSGSLPSEIGLWTSLTILRLPLNKLTGSLPSEIGLWTNLRYFGVANNGLTGTIPRTISNWKLIEGAWFTENIFSGSMPDGICDYLTGDDIMRVDCGFECSCYRCNPFGCA